MKIRQAQDKDRDDIILIYKAARSFMRKNGNLIQWSTGIMPETLVQQDIDMGNCYVEVDDNDRPHFVFSLVIGDDPSYNVIKEGKWLDDSPYGKICRIGSDGLYHGMVNDCIRFCERRINNLRVITHDDNKIMQHILEKNGFTRCAVIIQPDGTERLAFHRIMNVETAL
jgi:hypothetical protein